MRLLTEEETEIFFKKLGEYIGPNIKFLIDKPEDPYVFRMIDLRVYYVSEMIAKLAGNIGRDELLQYNKQNIIALGLVLGSSPRPKSLDYI